MAARKRRRINGDLSEYILLILHKEGPQTLQQLEEKTALQTAGFHSGYGERHQVHSEVKSVMETCDGMVCKSWIKLAESGTYQLTAEGRVQAEEAATNMERGARILETQILSPSAAARNSTVGYVCLAALKVVAGLFSGSVGLIADGADTTVDTAASAIVWAGIKFKKEILGTITILGLMFFTAIILFFNSAKSIIQNIEGTFLPMTMPYVVIVIELLAMLAMFIVSMYQRLVGKRSQSLPLISQSIDSKNSVYSSAAVIVGAVFTLFGIHWVDAVVGGFIAVRITLDGISLTRETAKTMRGQQPELSKYKMPFQKEIEQRRLENFRNWIMYCLHQDKQSSKEEIVASLEKTFRPSYMPTLFTEFTVGKGVNFDESFSRLIKPLLDDAYIVESNGKYQLTSKGKAYIKDTIDSMRYRQTEL